MSQHTIPEPPTTELPIQSQLLPEVAAPQYAQPPHTQEAPYVDEAQLKKKNFQKIRLAIGVFVIFFLLALTFAFVNKLTSTEALVPTPVQKPASAPATSTEPESESDAPQSGFSESTEEIISNLPSSPSAPSQSAGDGAVFTSFSPTGASVLCTNLDMAFPMDFSWSSQNATAAWFGVDTPNAKAAPLQQVDPNGSITWDFYCSNPQTTYTVTLEDASGKLTHHSIVVEAE